MKYNPIIHHRHSIRLKGYDYSRTGMYFVTICCQNRTCLFGQIEKGEMVLNEYGKIANDEWIKLSERYPNVLLDIFQIMPNHIHGIIALNDADAVGAGLAPALNENIIALNENIIAMNENMVAMNENTVAMNENTVAMNENTVAMNENTVAMNNRAGASQRAGASPAPTGDVQNGNVTSKNTIGNIVGAYKSLVANKCLEIFKSKNEYMGKLWQRGYWEQIIRNDESYQHIANYIIKNPVNWENDEEFHEV